jgi:hypothetical protein
MRVNADVNDRIVDAVTYFPFGDMAVNMKGLVLSSVRDLLSD